MSTQLVEPTRAGQRDDRTPLVVLLLVVMIALQLVGLIWLNAKVNAVQEQAAAASAAQVPASATDPSAADACRLLGGLAVKAGVDIATVFSDEPVSGACENTADEAAAAAKSAG